MNRIVGKNERKDILAMCNDSCIRFGYSQLTREEIHGKRVLEVGSIDINGNLRPIVLPLEPREYIGIDIEAGKGVDIICKAEDILDQFGSQSFDVVISTEMLEHVRDWRIVVSNIKNVCKPGGVVLITTRSIGFKYHGFPYDFWRFEPEDMKTIFSDFDILALQRDPEMPGVMMKAKKPSTFVENDLSGLSLYSIVVGKRISELQNRDFNSIHFVCLKTKIKIKELRKKIKTMLRHK